MPTINGKKFKYEVAISFLSRDEPFALELYDLLSPRFETFVYSKKQEAIAGKDGDIAFREAFLEHSRCVVVLYRAGWGDTPFTRVEQSAIRDRAHAAGFNFSLFVALEENPQLPPWLPKNKLYYGFPTYGRDGIAGAVERVIEDSGGDARKETLADHAARVSREIDYQKKRKSFLNSEKGYRDATKEVDAIFAASEEAINKIVAANSNMQLSVRRGKNATGRDCFAVTGHMCGLSIEWIPQWSNTLDDSQIRVTLWDGTPALFGQMFYNDPPTAQKKKIYVFDADRAMTLQVRQDGEKGDLMTRHVFVENCITWLLDEYNRANMTRDN